MMMKKRIGREVLWLLAPVVVLAGFGWYQARGGRLPAVFGTTPFDSGPKRVEYGAFEKADLTPRDVSQGFDWAVKTTVKTLGEWDVPRNWSAMSASSSAYPKSRLVYRRGTVWKTAQMRGKNGAGMTRWNSIFVEKSTSILVNLDTVPQDADEVRLRGTFVEEQWFRGPIPSGLMPPKVYASKGQDHGLSVESKPFDILIKKPLPKPIVSRDSGLQFVQLVLTSQGGRQVHLQLKRDETLPPVDYLNLVCVKWSLKDATGKKVNLCSANGSPGIIYFSTFSSRQRETLSPDFPKSDFLLDLMGMEIPCGGWAKGEGAFNPRIASERGR